MVRPFPVKGGERAELCIDVDEVFLPFVYVLSAFGEKCNSSRVFCMVPETAGGSLVNLSVEVPV